jgi:hypothetical protein
LLYRQPTCLICIDATAAVAAYAMLLLGRSAGVGGIGLRARGSGAALDEESPSAASEHDHGSFGGNGWLGATPYLRCLARPHGQPPNVTCISMVWRNLAMRLPFLAFVQIGHRFSQKSGSKKL